MNTKKDDCKAKKEKLPCCQKIRAIAVGALIAVILFFLLQKLGV